MNDLSRERSLSSQAGIVNGTTSYLLPGSGTENITLLNSTSNVDQPGVWLFRIDDFSPACMFKMILGCVIIFVKL